MTERDAENAVMLGILVLLLWRRTQSEVLIDYGGGFQPPITEPPGPAFVGPLQVPPEPIFYQLNPEYYFWESGGGSSSGFVGY